MMVHERVCMRGCVIRGCACGCVLTVGVYVYERVCMRVCCMWGGWVYCMWGGWVGGWVGAVCV